MNSHWSGIEMSSERLPNKRYTSPGICRQITPYYHQSISGWYSAPNRVHDARWQWRMLLHHLARGWYIHQCHCWMIAHDSFAQISINRSKILDKEKLPVQYIYKWTIINSTEANCNRTAYTLYFNYILLWVVYSILHTCIYVI